MCANTGFSAEIDRSGRLKQVGPRRSTKTINVQFRDVERGKQSLYRKIGDWVPFVFSGISLVAFLMGISRARRSNHKATSANTSASNPPELSEN